MILHTYFRSSAAFRVRIVLHLKGLAYEPSFVHLTRDGGEQLGDSFGALNPQALVPVLEDGDEAISQSLAICEYLEECYPQPPILPSAAADRARVRSLSQVIACEMHPVNNLRVLKYLTAELSLDETQRLAWYRHWIALGMETLEARLREDARTGNFCHGDAPTLADACLVPQVFNAERFDCDLSAYPVTMAIVHRCRELNAFQVAAPQAQPDAE